ncbi:MAG: hypothetical protein KDC92_07280 [Bacteroidetes bacterium]|nr:hypothetical protein [Bacteroidota bacterium]
MKKTLVLLLLLFSFSTFAQRLERRLEYTAELIEKGQYQEAQIQLERIIRKDDGIARAQHQLSLCYFYQGQVEKSLANAIESVKLDDDNADYIAHLGNVYYNRATIDKALQYWQNALLFDSTNTSALLGLSDHYTEQDSFEHALELLKQINAKTQKSIDWKYRRALCNQGLGNYKLAIQDYNYCIKENAIDELSMYHKSLCYLGLYNYDSMAISVEDLISLNANQAEYFYLLGYASEKQDLFSKAEFNYKKAISLDGDNVEYQSAYIRAKALNRENDMHDE